MHKIIIAVVAALTVSGQALAFLPERDDYEPLRIDACDAVLSPSITNSDGCMTVSGEVGAAYFWNRFEGVFGGSYAEITTQATERLGSLLTSAEIALVQTNSFSRHGGEFEDQAVFASILLGGENWAMGAGSLRETVLNFSNLQPFGNTLPRDFNWMHGLFHPLTGLQASAEVGPGLEVSAEIGTDGWWTNVGGSVSYASGPFS